MCLVIDINAIGSVLNPNADKHSDFEPVFNWIRYGKGKIIWGGTTYRNELQNGKYLKLLTRLGAKRKSVKIDHEKVDEIENQLKIECCDSKFREFDDHHIVALIIASKCKLICTGDERADKFLKDSSLYPDDVEVPSIYRNASHKHLINDDKIVKVCDPDVVLNTAVWNSLGYN